MRTALDACRLAYSRDSVYILPMLTLSEALKTDKLREFIAQEESRGIGPANSRDVEAAIKTLATTPTQSGDRTSRQPSRGGSTGK
jgi:hypothetical protein